MAVTIRQSSGDTLLDSFKSKFEAVVMNTSVSPLPLPVWPMLCLSLALVAFTSAAVTISAHRATQIYPTISQALAETTAPVTDQDLARERVAVVALREAH